MKTTHLLPLLTFALLLTGCAEQNLELKQELLDLDKQIQTTKQKLNNAQQIRTTAKKKTTHLQEKADTVTQEAQNTSNLLQELNKDLQTLQTQAKALAHSGKGYDQITLRSKKQLICTIDQLNTTTLSITTPDGTTKTTPINNIQSITFRHANIQKP